MKYNDLYVVEGKITVLVANEKGNTIGTTELLLNGVWIKTPKQPIFGGNPVIRKFSKKNKSGTLTLAKMKKLYKATKKIK